MLWKTLLAMDRKLIVVIATTAAITALVTWMVTKGADWLFGIARTRIASKVTRDKLSKIFTTSRRAIIGDLLWLAYCVSVLIWFVRRLPFVTGVAVIEIVFFVFAIFFIVGKLMWDVIGLLHERRP